mgnify:CR=1 FL=1
MLIDILLATYNGEKYIGEQLDSLFNQTNQYWTLIVHDDGSTDKTVEIIKSYQIRYPSRIVLLEDGIKTGGAKNNFAHLMQFSTSEYIMFCDQDDVWLEDKIELTSERMQEVECKSGNIPVLIHTDLTVVNNSLGILNKSFFKFQKIDPEISKSFSLSKVQNSVTGCTLMLNKIAKELVMPIPKNAVMHDWWILLSILRANGVVEFINKPTVLYRQHLDNQVGARGFSILKLLTNLSTLKVYQNMCLDLGLSESYLKLFVYKLYVFILRIIRC